MNLTVESLLLGMTFKMRLSVKHFQSEAAFPVLTQPSHTWNIWAETTKANNSTHLPALPFHPLRFVFDQGQSELDRKYWSIQIGTAQETSGQDEMDPNTKCFIERGRRKAKTYSTLVALTFSSCCLEVVTGTRLHKESSLCTSLVKEIIITKHKNMTLRSTSQEGNFSQCTKCFTTDACA